MVSVPKKTTLLQARTKFRKYLKGIFNFCKLQILFKSQNKLLDNFHFKGRIPKVLQNLYLVRFINISVNYAMKSFYGECVRELNVRIGKHIANFNIDKKES